MHPVPGRMHTLCAEKIDAKKSFFCDTFFFNARFRRRENAHIWKRRLCIDMIPIISLAKMQEKSRTWKAGLHFYEVPLTFYVQMPYCLKNIIVLNFIAGPYNISKRRSRLSHGLRRNSLFILTTLSDTINVYHIIRPNRLVREKHYIGIISLGLYLHTFRKYFSFMIVICLNKMLMKTFTYLR